VGRPGSECHHLRGAVGYLKGSVMEADRPESEVDMGSAWEAGKLVGQRKGKATICFMNENISKQWVVL
jgi:hypothetical protein